MPGFTTHYVLGMKAYNDMPQNNLKFIIAKYRWLYQLGLQGPDMFFYNLPILRHRDHRNVGSHMHEHHVNDFFRCCFLQLARIDSRQQQADRNANDRRNDNENKHTLQRPGGVEAAAEVSAGTVRTTVRRHQA